MARQTKIGNTRGGRGRLGSNIRTMSDYYNSGRASAFNPGGAVKNKAGATVAGKAKS